jgi:hypothetical protein
VVTSDYGAGTGDGGSCERSPGGQRGLLQALGQAAPSGCAKPTAPFIHYAVDEQGVVTSNLPPGQTLDQTFTCMASVGAYGCGYEHQLESVYAALHGDALTSGFLRDDAALTVVFITNEDDGSAPPFAHFYDGTPAFGQPLSTYAQSRYAVSCDGGTIPDAFDGGPATFKLFQQCAGAPNPSNSSQLAYDVSRYTAFFGQPRSAGGVKDNPSEVALIALAAPPTPFSTIAYAVSSDALNGALHQAPCGPLLSSQCFEAVKHSCQNQVDPNFFGDPAVRLAQVVEAAPLHQFTSICGEDQTVAPDFTSQMSGIGELMASQTRGGCLFRAPVAATPQCTVRVNGGALDPCTTGRSVCWKVVQDASCPAVMNPATGGSSRLRLTLVGVDATASVDASCRVYN